MFCKNHRMYYVIKVGMIQALLVFVVSANVNLQICDDQSLCEVYEYENGDQSIHCNFQFSEDVKQAISCISTSPKEKLISSMILTFNISTPIQLENSFLSGLNISRLSLMSLNTTEIPSLAFNGVQSLNNLIIMKGNLKQVPSGALQSLNSLKVLSLDKNEIITIPDLAFKELKSLEWLYLTGNKISNIENLAFAGLDNLTILNLGSNLLTAMPVESFKYLSSLETLDLSDNKIEELKPQDFLGLTLLRSLFLRRNRISTVQSDAFSGLEESLNALSMGGNLLTEVPIIALQYMKNLTSVELGTQISELNPDTFKNFGKTILSLDLGENRISILPKKLLKHLPNVKVINLEKNQLQRLDVDVFRSNLKTLTSVYIEGNPLICDCELYWYREFTFNHNPAYDAIKYEICPAKEKHITYGMCNEHWIPELLHFWSVWIATF